MFAFATKVSDSGSELCAFNYDQASFDQAPDDYFSDFALRNIEEATRDCDDAAPPLCTLLALILITHWLLIQRVRGRA
jgi:hypothetical protein